MRKGLIKKSLATLVATIIGISTLGSIPMIKTSAAVNNLDFGAGQGIKFPDKLCAPYADLVDYYEVAGYSNNGVIYLPKIMEDTGIKYYNGSFIQSAGGVEGGKVKWGWGGHSVLSESSTDKWQYSGIIKSIKDLREKGGDVIIAFGGAAGTAFWQTTQDVNVLAATYTEIIDGYNLTRIDLDIEGDGGAMDREKNIANAKAIKKVQDETGVEVTLTLPVLPSGLDSKGVTVLEAYLSQGVNVKMVNIMAMCYGSGVLLPGENYGTGSVRAIDSTMKQVQQYVKKHQNITLTDSEAYALVGVTTSVGFESASDPIFTPQWSKLVTDHAISKNIGMTSFWSINKDSMLLKNSGITAKYEHSNEYKRFPGNQVPVDNYKPVLSGVENKTITIGQAFNNMNGVKAIDKEDGDITSKVTVTGSVNTSVAGSYQLIYSVTDSKGATTTATTLITVKELPAKSEDVNSDGKVDLNDLALLASQYNMTTSSVGFDSKYDINNDGIIDIYDLTKVARKIGSDDGNQTTQEWKSGVSYKVGDLVTYQNKTYKCLVAHTSHEGWLPGVAFTIWEEVK